MKKLCLIRPAHKTDHPMGTESTASLDTYVNYHSAQTRRDKWEKGSVNEERKRTRTGEKGEIR